MFLDRRKETEMENLRGSGEKPETMESIQEMFRPEKAVYENVSAESRPAT